jgi:hypothetical protein
MSDATELGYSIIQCSEGELSELIRTAKPYVVHTWGTVNGGLLWRKCPWVVPMICDMRGIPIPDHIRKGFNERSPEK